jgi:hypothetical protein
LQRGKPRFGRQTPVFRRDGGSIPVVTLLKEMLGLECVLLGFGSPDGNAHGPDGSCRSITSPTAFVRQHASMMTFRGGCPPRDEYDMFEGFEERRLATGGARIHTLRGVSDRTRSSGSCRGLSRRCDR